MLKIAIVLATLVAVCSARNQNGLLYPFVINSQLVCHVPNPFADLPGQPLTIPEPVMRVPLTPTLVMNDGLFTGNISYQQWLPQESGFRMPSLKGLNRPALMAFLGDDFNSVLTRDEAPIEGVDVPRACDILPAIEGSAGQQLSYMEVVGEPISLLDNIANNMPNSLIYNQTVAELTARGLGANLQELNNILQTDEVDLLLELIRTTINSDSRVWDLWIAHCPLTPTWLRLPDSYYPRFIAQSVCSAKNCSLPRGLTCQEDFTAQVFVSVLRWDCCYNHLNRETRWDCGWRRVQIPIFCDCTCGCNETG